MFFKDIYMILDDLQEQLKALEPLIKTITIFWENSSIEKTIKELEEKTAYMQENLS